MEGGAGRSSEGDSTRYLGDREGLYADTKEKENHLTLIVQALKWRDTESQSQPPGSSAGPCSGWPGWHGPRLKGVFLSLPRWAQAGSWKGLPSWENSSVNFVSNFQCCP